MKKKKILLVDEAGPLLDLVTARIVRGGYEVGTADTAEEVIHQLNTGGYDLVVTEFRLPGVDVFQVIRAARSLARVPGIIMFTGSRDIAPIVEGLNLGADDYLLKPCIIDDLLVRISHCLGRRAKPPRMPQPFDGILPVCSKCKKIRDDDGVPRGTGKWVDFDYFLAHNAKVMVSHGMCPECFDKMGDII